MQKSQYKKYVDTIKKEEFVNFFKKCDQEKWFSKREMQKFSFPQHTRSLAGRYLIKRTICDYLNEYINMNEIEIINNDLGKPEVFFGAGILKTIEFAGIKKVLCSISHSKNHISGLTIFCF